MHLQAQRARKAPAHARVGPGKTDDARERCVKERLPSPMASHPVPSHKASYRWRCLRLVQQFMQTSTSIPATELTGSVRAGVAGSRGEGAPRGGEECAGGDRAAADAAGHAPQVRPPQPARCAAGLARGVNCTRLAFLHGTPAKNARTDPPGGCPENIIIYIIIYYYILYIITIKISLVLYSI